MARTQGTWEEYDGSYVAVPWDDGRNVLIRGNNKYLNFGSLVGSSGYGIRDNAGVIEFKDSGDAWTSMESLANQWQRITRNGETLIEPVNQIDNLHLGTMTDFSSYLDLANSRAWFTTQADAGYFTTVVTGSPVLFNSGQIWMSVRGRGTLNNPTTISHGDGMGTMMMFGFDSNNDLAISANGQFIFSPMAVFAGTATVGDVPQEVHYGKGLLGNGMIRLNSNNQLAFYGLAPVARPTNAIAAAAFVANTSGIVNDTATWGGYTGGQIVAALQTIGLLT